MKITYAAACVLVDLDGRVLVADRPVYKEIMPGYWEFPGGKVEEGEAPEDCVRREVEEEIGVKLGCMAPLNFISESRQGENGEDGYHVVVYVFICREWEGIPVPKEGQQFKWMKPIELNQLEKLLPANKPLISVIRDMVGR